MRIVVTIVALFCSYIIGSFPTAYIAGRLGKGIDIRDFGSRNMGAMNVFYTLGFASGLIVLAIDIGKGAAGVALARWLGVPLYAQLAAGIAVVVGHAFPVFLKFKGGKGGAAVIGILAYLMPRGIPFYVGIFALLTLITRFPTLSYSLAFLCYPFLGWLKYHSAVLSAYSLAVLILPLLKYVPRIIEIRQKAGSWRRAITRRGLTDRL
jgi:glycerol-3-phosphate acyltransferase PlsY